MGTCLEDYIPAQTTASNAVAVQPWESELGGLERGHPGRTDPQLVCRTGEEAGKVYGIPSGVSFWVLGQRGRGMLRRDGLHQAGNGGWRLGGLQGWPTIRSGWPPRGFPLTSDQVSEHPWNRGETLFQPTTGAGTFLSPILRLLVDKPHGSVHRECLLPFPIARTHLTCFRHLVFKVNGEGR